MRSGQTFLLANTTINVHLRRQTILSTYLKAETTCKSAPGYQTSLSSNRSNTYVGFIEFHLNSSTSTTCDNGKQCITLNVQPWRLIQRLECLKIVKQKHCLLRQMLSQSQICLHRNSYRISFSLHLFTWKPKRVLHWKLKLMCIGMPRQELNGSQQIRTNAALTYCAWDSTSIQHIFGKFQSQVVQSEIEIQ